MGQKLTIVGVHLLNDYSGSPLVFSQILKDFVKQGYKVELYTGKKSTGFLSRLKGTNRHNAHYHWYRQKWLTLLAYLFSQFMLFWKLLRYRKSNTVFYLNTMLPFGAAFAGKVLGKKVIFHIHETSIRPALLKRFLRWTIKITATEVIYVSHYLAEKESLEHPGKYIIYNALRSEFVGKAARNIPSTEGPVLMLASLKKYKGITQFIQLSNRLPQYPFELVLNATEKEISLFLEAEHLECPSNLKIFPAQEQVHQFYKRASLVLNLSLPDQWIETFGLTALEAMAHGVPVIVPPVGGIAEIVENGVQGFHVNAYKGEALADTVESLLSDTVHYRVMSEAAKRKAKQFTEEKMSHAIAKLLPGSMVKHIPKMGKMSSFEAKVASD